MTKSFIETLYNKRQLLSASFPDSESVHDFSKHLFAVLFESQPTRFNSITEFEKEFKSLQSQLTTLVYYVTHDPTWSQQVMEEYFEAIPSIYEELLKDATAIADHDPAAVSVDEVIAAYPGFYAIALYRISHELYLLNVPIIPRLITEFAHTQTGIDIHPGADIGESFFIDHGTGIVIGETAVIGNNVKIFQGVTIGALLMNGEANYGKRHPTIEDDVIIYAGATILGGNTTIGGGSIIGGNVWLTSTVPPFSNVFQHTQVIPLDIDGTVLENEFSLL